MKTKLNREQTIELCDLVEQLVKEYSITIPSACRLAGLQRVTVRKHLGDDFKQPTGSLPVEEALLKFALELGCVPVDFCKLIVDVAEYRETVLG